MRKTFAWYLLLATAAYGQNLVGGPDIPSRVTGDTIGRIGNTQVHFQAFAGVNGVYDSGLVPTSLDSNGKVAQTSGYGVETNYGVTFFDTFKGGNFALNYIGDFREYSAGSSNSGLDQTAAMRFDKRLSKRWQWVTAASGSSLSRFSGSVANSVVSSTSISSDPGTQLFDSRDYTGDVSTKFIYAPTNRLSFSMGGDGIIVRRKYSQLVGYQGGAAKGDVAYRLNRSQTVSGSYNYVHIEYQGAFGGTDLHQALANYGVQFGRRYQLNLSLGGYRVETKGIRYVTVDPIVAALLGITQTAAIAHVVTYVPSYTGEFTGKFRRSSIALLAGQTVNPGGNGIYLASKQRTVSLTGTYVSRDRLTYSGGLAYYSLNTLSQNLVGLQTVNLYASVNYRLRSALYATATYSYRDLSAGQGYFARDSNRVTLGVAYTLSRLPLLAR